MGRGSKNLSKGNRKLALMHESESLHYRMYKAGRTWLFAGIATFSLGAVLLGTQVQASAATTGDTTPTAQQQQQPAVTNTATDTSQQQTTASNTTPSATTGTATDTAATGSQTSQTSTGVPGEITKKSTSNVGIEAGTVTGNEGTVNAPAGATKDPDTSGAVIKTNMFGNGLENDSTNSATAGVGANNVTQANNKNNQNGGRKADGTGSYGNAYGNSVPDSGTMTKTDSEGTVKLNHAGANVNSKNDKLDQIINDSEVKLKTRRRTISMIKALSVLIVQT